MVDINLIIHAKGRAKIYDVSSLAEDSITLTTQRKGSPAKLDFKIARNALSDLSSFEFYEGDCVMLNVNGTDMFKGYIFSKSRTKEHIISVTAYDQTRYFKNKDTVVYENRTASELIQSLASQFNVLTGVIEDTEYKIPERSEDNVTLWDIFDNALSLTTINTGKLYILYDDFGLLTLKNIDSMFVPLIVSDKTTLIDFNFKTDIDSDTYNQVKLYRDNDKKRQTYVVQNTLNVMKWGVLQYTEQISEHYSEAKIAEIANLIMKQKNRVKKTLSIEDIGDTRIRAGCGIKLDIKDAGEVIDQIAVINQCTHTFKNNEHLMKLELEEL